MMRLLVSAMLALATPSDGDNTPWSSNPRMLACAPEVLRPPAPLVLSLGPGHGRELAIRRVADDRWYFLVVQQPLEGTPLLMTPEAFTRAKRVEVPMSFEGRASVESPLAPVFRTPGAYEVYVSDALESDLGGHVCKIEYRGVSSRARPGTAEPARGT
ncbi:hypothetical protein [Luteimonas terrae]|uniref:Uncharacterized protein n=1 Tax=Luteimonas terrae TaxID=1530191 RepID=A0A4R5U694_9GAMM|nr:hypothetical protein [Luteimonas terrae]TDK29522.1 hypothetical protein E2F49_14205 [Luteimonas terrae]